MPVGTFILDSYFVLYACGGTYHVQVFIVFIIVRGERGGVIDETVPAFAVVIGNTGLPCIRLGRHLGFFIARCIFCMPHAYVPTYFSVFIDILEIQSIFPGGGTSAHIKEPACFVINRSGGSSSFENIF